MEINDATSIGIPRIVDPILGTDELSKSNEIIKALKGGSSILVSLDTTSQRFLINEEVSVIGRERSVDIFLDDYSVSRNHAEIIHRQDKWYIEDSGSLNGTYVNRELTTDQVEIKSGDEIQIGRYHLGFYCK